MVHHQTIIIDQAYFRFQHDINIITKALRSVLLIAGGLHRNGLVGELPSISLLVFLLDAKKGMDIILPPTVLTGVTFNDILGALDKHRPDLSLGRPESLVSCVDWTDFMSSLKEVVHFPSEEEFQVTYFHRNRQISFDEFALPQQMVSMILVSINRASLLIHDSDDDDFGRTTLSWHQVKGFRKPVVDVGLAPFIAEVEDFFKRFVFSEWIGNVELLEIILPLTSFSKLPISISCVANQRLLPPYLVPGLLFGENSPSKIQIPANRERPRLEALKLIKSSGICQSLVFGYQNHLVAPHEDGSNHERFSQLLQRLESNQASLLVRAGYSQQGRTRPHFILTPASNGCLLLKSIATGDAISPLTCPPPFRTSTSTVEGIDSSDKALVDRMAIMEVESSLSKLKVNQQFVSFDYHCGMHKFLEDQAKRIRPKTSASARGSGPSARGRKGQNKSNLLKQFY